MNKKKRGRPPKKIIKESNGHLETKQEITIPAINVIQHDYEVFNAKIKDIPVDNAIIKEIEVIVEKPIYKEVIVEKPIYKEVIVEKPIYKEVIIEKPIYKEKEIEIETPKYLQREQLQIIKKEYEVPVPTLKKVEEKVINAIIEDKRVTNAIIQDQIVEAIHPKWICPICRKNEVTRKDTT